MKRIVVSSALAVALLSSAVVAEESGAFVGLGVGYGNTTAKSEGTKEKMTGGVNVGILAGYKQFFTDSFGLRYYANVDFSQAKQKEGEKEALNTINFGVNVDALYNFISGETNFGAFIGLGVGANKWSGKTLSGLENKKTLGADVALNVGLRSVIATNHGIELAVRVPFVANKLSKDFDLKANRQFNAGVRYIFSF